MKKIFIIIAIITITTISFAKQTLTVYAPQSYQWLKTDGIIKNFEIKNNVTVKFIEFSGASKIVSRLILEKNYPRADVIMGLSQTNFLIAKKNNLLAKYKPTTFKNIKNQNNIISKNYFATLFDYGGLAIIYHPNLLKNPPTSFKQLLKYKKSIIIEDPRTSSTGQDFLIWTIGVYGKNWKNYWKKFKLCIKYIAPNWNSAFALFQTGAAPMMVSFASDNAYANYTYHKSKYKILIPSEGDFVMVEGTALVNRKHIKSVAKQFINYTLTKYVQKHIPLGNWMLPATNIKLPTVFKYYVHSKKHIYVSNKKVSQNLNNWILNWSHLIME